jgi:hypothetical protein
MSEVFLGPTFELVETTDWHEVVRNGGFGPRTAPLLVKGAVRAWPAFERWTFENLAALRRPDGSEVVFRFQNGLVEQGVTKPPLDLAIAPYIEGLARSSAQAQKQPDTGLLPYERWSQIHGNEKFHLDWTHMDSFRPDQVYLAQWNILEEFPAMRKDFAIRKLWPGWRWTWEFVFIGPSNTVTGLHYDFPNNWFCQVHGTKEVILFPPDQSPYMCKSLKYDWGATLSDINISNLDGRPAAKQQFAQAHGLYARVEAGDALFIPRRTWHAVVSLEPSISLGVFGLTPSEIVLGGAPSEARHLLHKLHMYRWNNCTCHRMQPAIMNSGTN